MILLVPVELVALEARSLGVEDAHAAPQLPLAQLVVVDGGVALDISRGYAFSRRTG